MLFWYLKSIGWNRHGRKSSCRQCSSLLQQSVSYYEEKVKHKALSKMQTAKIKSIRLFHTFCFYTYGTTHPVMWFLLLVWKKCCKKCLCEPPALLFFWVRGSAQVFPQALTLFEWPIICLARSHTTLHTSANAWYLLP